MTGRRLKIHLRQDLRQVQEQLGSLNHELGGAEYIDEPVSADGKSNCWMEGWVGQSTLKSQFQRVAGLATEDSSMAGSEYIVTSMTVPSEVATSVGKEKLL